MTKRIVLAYSGGLDTSVAIGWITEQTGAEVIALAVDVGQGGEDLDTIRQRALDCGATESVVADARAEFAAGYCLPALRANALYQQRYPLVSALSRPLIVSHLAAVAREYGATMVSHGCTGKGNDQVRFEAGLAALAPGVSVFAPVRDSGMTRDKAIAFAAEKGLPIEVTAKSPYSIDQNLWGRSCETGHLEDIWEAPHDDVWGYTSDPAQPQPADEVTISFADGLPVALDGAAAQPAGADHRAAHPRRAAGRRPDRHGRGPAGGDQEPGDLRGPGRDRADHRAPGAGSGLPGARPGPVQAAGRAALDRAGLRRAVVLAAAQRARGVHGRGVEERDRRRPGPAARRPGGGHRPAQRGQPVRLRAGHLRHRRLLRPGAGQGVHRAVGPAQQDRRQPGPPVAGEE